MHNEKILQIVADKINDTKVALFYSLSDSQLKINTTVIQTLKVDRQGQVFFWVARPLQIISHFDQEFPAGLNYFKKGNAYSLKILGTATIVSDFNEILHETGLTPEEIKNVLSTQILLRVQIAKVDYHDYNYDKKNVLFKKISSFIARLWPGEASASYILSPKTLSI